MITEEEKYKAETFRVLGIAMILPAGAVFLTPTLLNEQLGLFGTTVYIMVSFTGCIMGSILIEAGRRILDKSKGRIRSRWDQMN